MSVVFSITLSLLVIGLFGLLLVHSQRLTAIIQENVQLQVYLQKNITDSERNRLERILGTKDYVFKNEETPRVEFISRDDAAQAFIKATGEDFTDLLGENPLRDLFVINVAFDYQSLDSLEVVEADINALRGVYEVNYVASLVQSINENLTKIGLVLLGFALVLFLVVVILINNTIKLALFSQRFLIRSMQLVGATGTFIKRPFLIRSALYGGIAGLLACGLLYLLYRSAIARVENLAQLRDEQSLLLLSGVIITMGVFVAYFSTMSAITRYLKTSLDELY
ncbi:MAG: permease-like cell division protein FtsX [Bacteroidota bacterium]